MPLKAEKESGEDRPPWEGGEMDLMAPQVPEGLLGGAPGLAGSGMRAPGLGKRQQNYKTQRNHRKCDSELLRGNRRVLFKCPEHW